MKLETNQPLLCPCCKTELAGIIGEAAVLPKENDFSVCAYCAQIIILKGRGMHLRMQASTRLDLHQLKHSDPKAYRTIVDYRNVVLGRMLR